MSYVYTIIGIILFAIGVPIISFISTLIQTLSDYVTVRITERIAWYNHMIQKINSLDEPDGGDPAAIGFEIHAESDVYEDEE